MTSLIIASLSAFWFGVLTSISPCPLATNIAAISYSCKQMESTNQVFLNGLYYTIGRVVAYVVIGIITLYSLVNIPGLSTFLQTYTNMLLGPILILMGMLLLDLIGFKPKSCKAPTHESKSTASSIFSPFSLGFMFALSFCPSSAVLFFGSLIPLAISHQSGFFLPAIYGIGTGVPVFLFALIIAFSTNSVSNVLNRVNTFAIWAKHITGVIFIGVGIKYSFTYIFGLA